ncbi:hypothetical protein HYDPIDRAFT_189201 [Hydnomerulius pinastri MD-312]|uniref:Vacuolar sorting protein 39/Transforming growth factor beta receptor-associated domain-containing protein n=1 Tax=Hydnomerulius pinastri MD-312 TaxID=994086 RepID=A0A0C9VVK2_9AGAM|nr:hypothetical protein HYDPIDRAFT_189201 [Hydnomerulius pinastri MD-312]
MRHPSYPRSSVLVFGQSSVHSLLPSTLFAQAQSLLQNGRLAEAEALLDTAEAEFAQGSGSAGDQTETLQYFHQCLAFAFMRRTSFREAMLHFVRGAIDPRIVISYFEELRPALFDGEEEAVDVEVWEGVREYMPQEKSVDDIIATNLVRNYSPYLRSSSNLPPTDTASSASSSSSSDSHFEYPNDDGAQESSSHPPPPHSNEESGTKTHPATIAMREGLRVEAGEMVKGVLGAVLANAGAWGMNAEVVEITRTALALQHAHAHDIPSLLALLSPPLPPSRDPSETPRSRTHSRASSRPTSRPPSRPSSTSHVPPPSDPPSHSHSQAHPSIGTVRSAVLAPVLGDLGLWGVLIELWKGTGEGGRVLGVLVGLVEGTHTDPSVPDPLGQIFAMLSPPSSNAGTGIVLSEQERRALIRKWGAWLAGKDVERGMKLLTSTPQPARTRRPTAGGRVKENQRDQEQEADELAILAELRAGPGGKSGTAAKQYLEWLVVGRGRENPSLHDELVRSCIDELFGCLEDENVGRLWRAKAASYASSPSTSSSSSSSPPPSSRSPPAQSLPQPTSIPAPAPRPPFLSYFASTTPDSPSKRARIKALLVLQSLRADEDGGTVKEVQDRIMKGGWGAMLGLETAVLYSKVPSPPLTLRTLHTLRDTLTAEAYASSGGAVGVVSTKVGVSAAEGVGMGEWASWFARGVGSGAGAGVGEKGGKEEDMLKMLLKVYMEEGDMQQTARLLSSQAGRLDVVDIIPLVPSAWPLKTLTPYLTRSLRRTLHTSHEGQIVKSICAGQNLAALEATWEVLREEGCIVEEAVSDDEDGEEFGEFEGGKGGEGGEGKSFDEKVALRGGVGGAVEVVGVDVGGEGEGEG